MEPLEHLGINGLGAKISLATGWKTDRARGKSAHADLNVEYRRAVGFGTRANGRHDAALLNNALFDALRLDITPASRETVPAVCQGHSATPPAYHVSA